MSDIHGNFWEHVEELRRVIIRCLFIIFISIACTFFFHEPLLNLLTSPLEKMRQESVAGSGLQKVILRQERLYNPGPSEIIHTLAEGQLSSARLSTGVTQLSDKTFSIPPNEYLDLTIPQSNRELAIFGPLEGVKITLKVCFWIGLVFSSPFWMCLLAQFIAPALRKNEKGLVFPFLALSFLFLSLGFLFAFFITVPLANQYLYAFNSTIGMNLWSFSHYLDYTVILLLANGLAFELGVVALFLVQLQILTASTMAHYRRHTIVLAFVIAAILTPPDVVTQTLLAVPLIVLYELIIIYARFLGAVRADKGMVKGTIGS